MIITQNSPFLNSCTIKVYKRAKNYHLAVEGDPEKLVQVGLVYEIDLEKMKAKRRVVHVEKMLPESPHYDSEFKLELNIEDIWDGFEEYAWEDVDSIEIVRKQHVEAQVISTPQAQVVTPREKLAALEHEQWAHWTKYMLDTIQPLLAVAEGAGLPEAGSGEPEASAAVDRWRRQIETPYSELTEKEKASDREWADKAMAVMREA